MSLLNNPFFILGVSTRDSSQKILEAAETKSLLIDADVCITCKSVLTNPRQRLAAEVSWLPGLAPGRANDITHKITSAPNEISQNINSFGPLIKCNIIETILDYYLGKFEEDHAKQWLLLLADACESIDLDATLNLLNEDRIISGITQIQNIDDLEIELANRKKCFVSIGMRLLHRVKNPDIFLTDVIVKSVASMDIIPSVIENITEEYFIQVKKYLDEFESRIERQLCRIEHISKDGNRSTVLINKLIDDLIVVLREWDKVVQPMQLVNQKRGIDDDVSFALATKIRNTSIDLSNEYSLHNEAKKITDAMFHVFRELPQFAVKIEEDISALKEIIANKNNTIEEENKWKRDISLNIEFGTLFKKRLVITPDRVVFDDTTLLMNEISRIRWGTYINYTNGIKTNTSHGVWIGTRNKTVHIECSLKFESDKASYDRFSTVVDKLWKAVGIRLVMETLSMISNDGKIPFGRKGLLVDKDGMILHRYKTFGANQPVHCKWEEITYLGIQGQLSINSKKEKGVCSHLSYRDDDNTHVLESLLDFIYKDGNHIKLRQGSFH